MFRICKFTYLFVRRHPFAIHITPQISAKCTIHISVKAHLLQTVIGSYIQTVENTIPYIFLILHYRIKIPTKSIRDFLLQIFRSIWNTHQRNTGTSLHHRMLFRIKFDIKSCIFQVLTKYMASIQYLLILPATYFLNRCIKLYYEVHYIFLISVITPHIRTRRNLMRASLNSIITYLLNIYIQQIIIIFSLHMKVNHYTSIFIFREGIFLETCSFCSCHLRPDFCIGQEDLIIS